MRKTRPDIRKAKDYVIKAEHYLKATEYLKEGNFSDISASTVFYSMYHCLLAIAAKFGYDSRNQECTFSLIHGLVDEGKIGFEVWVCPVGAPFYYHEFAETFIYYV